MEKIKVLYIMGTARSGSTILEILLAHGEHCVGVGELTSIVQDGFIENKSCSCGMTFDQCDFWGKVVQELALSRGELHEWAQLQYKVEWHTGFLRQWLGLLTCRDWQRYQGYNLRLLQALRKVSGAGVIVDSSKYAGRAMALARMPEIDLSVICLTRSPEGLVASFQKPNKEEQHPKKPWAVFRYYIFVLFTLRVALKRLWARAMVLHYEDFIAEPVERIKMIANKNWVNFDVVIKKISNDEIFEIGHLVTGNRLRKNKAVRINREQNSQNADGKHGILPLKLMKFIEAIGWRKN